MIRPEDRYRQERQRRRSLVDGVSNADSEARKRQRSQMEHHNDVAANIDGGTTSSDEPAICDDTQAGSRSSAASVSPPNKLQVQQAKDSESRRGLVCEFSLPPGAPSFLNCLLVID